MMHFTVLILVTIGAFFFWMLSGFKGSFTDQAREKNEGILVIAGLFFLVVLIFLIYYFFYYFFGMTKEDWNRPI